MGTITYTTARKNLKSVFDEACENSSPIIITRRNGDDVVVLSLDDFQSLDETSYLLRSPKNAKILKKSMKQLENNEITEFDPTLA